MPRTRLTLRCLTCLAAVATLGCSVPSRSDLEVMQAVNDLGDAVNGLRQEYGILAEQLDSLRLVMNKQDSLIRVLANLAGVAVPSTP